MHREQILMDGMKMKTIIGTLLFLSFFMLDLLAEDWSLWRGPGQNGMSSETQWNQDWKRNPPKLMWKKDIGRGYATVTKYRGMSYSAGNAGGEDTVWCFDSVTGKVIWKRSFDQRSGSYAGPRVTPQVYMDRLFFITRSAEVYCLNPETGELYWSKDLRRTDRADVPMFGYACHPVFRNDVFYLEIGASNGAVAAFRVEDGESVWKSGDGATGYSTPNLWNNGEFDELIVHGGESLSAFRADNGRQLWSVPWRVYYQCVGARPLVHNGKVFVSSAYRMGSALYEAGGGRVKKRWSDKDFSLHFNAAVYDKGYLYAVHGEKYGDPYLRCVEFETGKTMWSRGGYGKGSVILADGKLIVQCEDGQVALVEATHEEARELGRFKAVDGTCWNVPVLTNSRLYSKSHDGEIACFDLGK